MRKNLKDWVLTWSEFKDLEVDEKVMVVNCIFGIIGSLGLLVFFVSSAIMQ